MWYPQGLMDIRAAPGTGLLLDAAGTLLHLAEPMPRTYTRFARRSGFSVEEQEVADRIAQAFSVARPRRRGTPDWRDYWREVVRVATGVSSDELVGRLIDHYAHAPAWNLAEGAAECCRAVRERGMKVAVVSNWDTRLRPLLEELGVLGWVDLAVISGEELIEKPHRQIFWRACERLGVPPERALHVGDSIAADLAGATHAGCQALLWGRDVKSFGELRELLVTSSEGPLRPA